MAKITDKINEVTGNDDGVAKEQFSFLQKVAEAKCKEFRTELEAQFMGEKSATEITGRKAIGFHSESHVNVHKDADESILKSMDNFFTGKSGVKEGFKNILRAAVNSLCGNLSIGENYSDMFFIFPENNAIVRLDVKTYTYKFSSNNIIATSENIFCYTMVKSVVNHKTLSKDELLYFITQMFNSGDDEKKIPISEISDFIKELISIWNLLESETIADNTSGMLKSAKNPNLISEDEIFKIIARDEEE